MLTLFPAHIQGKEKAYLKWKVIFSTISLIRDQLFKKLFKKHDYSQCW